MTNKLLEQLANEGKEGDMVIFRVRSYSGDEVEVVGYLGRNYGLRNRIMNFNNWKNGVPRGHTSPHTSLINLEEGMLDQDKIMGYRIIGFPFK